MEHHELHVEGMSCTACEAAITSDVQSLGGVSRVEADREADTVSFVAADSTAVGDAGRIIEDLGYEVTVREPGANGTESPASGD